MPDSLDDKNNLVGDKKKSGSPKRPKQDDSKGATPGKWRRKNVAFLIAMIAASATLLAANAPSIGSIPLKNIDGKDTTLAAYKGKVVLVVNVASKCGLTPQYSALEATYQIGRAHV